LGEEGRVLQPVGDGVADGAVGEVSGDGEPPTAGPIGPSDLGAPIDVASTSAGLADVERAAAVAAGEQPGEEPLPLRWPTGPPAGARPGAQQLPGVPVDDRRPRSRPDDRPTIRAE